MHATKERVFPLRELNNYNPSLKKKNLTIKGLHKTNKRRKQQSQQQYSSQTSFSSSIGSSSSSSSSSFSVSSSSFPTSSSVSSSFLIGCSSCLISTQEKNQRVKYRDLHNLLHGHVEGGVESRIERNSNQHECEDFVMQNLCMGSKKILEP